MAGKTDNLLAMRKIHYTPDYVHIECDIGIRWLQEAYFKSIARMPLILLGKETFTDIRLSDRDISVPVEQWIAFTGHIVSSFRDGKKERKDILTNMYQQLADAEIYTNKIYSKVYGKGILPGKQEIFDLIQIIINLDSYAVFNMFMPCEYYIKQFQVCRLEPQLCNVDNLMVCMFEPHRILVRKKKLKLALQYQKNELGEESIFDYLKEIAVYEQFADWIFGVEKLLDTRFIKKELKKLAGCFTKKELEEEYRTLDRSRDWQVYSLYSLLHAVGKSSAEREEYIDKFLYLTHITTEEEKRHMIECRIFAVLGYVFSQLKIDSTRYSLEELHMIIHYLNKGEEECSK
ncbi:hypothetical protein [Clostridium sp. E02]|uniref:hypothetical protein n=1 Tax=Clostridium sp. E02 TaxID=2487134 RepID=UPI000F525A02|nr:hypothetical protein [Clostridium sp. E02]